MYTSPTKKRKNYREAKVVGFKKYSEDRVEPFCEHFGVCGGCKWQNLPYDKQLYYKQKQVFDQLTRIGKIDLPEILPIKGSANTTFYRNKLEYTFSNSSKPSHPLSKSFLSYYCLLIYPLLVLNQIK